MRGMERSATGEDASLDGPNASKSREYLEVAGDDGSGLGNAPRGGDDCILLESMSRSREVLAQYCLCASPLWIVRNISARGDARLLVWVFLLLRVA